MAMHAAREPERPSDGLPRLGELLVATGVVSADVIEQALAAQKESGLPLGRVLVEGGFVPGHKIAMALADQNGGPVRTEYGLATGRGAAAPVPIPINAPAPAPPPLLSVAPSQPLAAVPAPPPVVAPAPVEQPAPAVEAHTLVVEPEPVVHVEPVDTRELDALTASLEEARAALAGELAKRAAAEDALVRALATADEARTTLDTERSARERTESALAGERAGREAAEAAAAELRAQVEQLSAALEAKARDPRACADDRHVLYVPGEEYRIVERSGAAPAVDDQLELDGLRYVVTRVGAAPFPGERIACAYLDALVVSEA